MTRALKVLFVTNASTERCGVRVYGELWIDALRRARVEIDVCDGTYSTIYHRKWYLPADLSQYSLIHLNWDPQATNHFLPEHFPTDVPLSVFLHDVPPNSTCPVFDQAALRIAMEPGEGIEVIDHAVPDLLPSAGVGWVPGDPIIIGTSGIRDDPGVGLVDQVCRAHGWQHSRSGESGWLTTQQEIDRLASCTVNVCWYQTSGRGKSMAAMFACAARRPLVLSGSSMFSALDDWDAELYHYRDTHRVELAYQTWLPVILPALVSGVQNSRAVYPNHVCDEHSWSRCAERIKALWEGVAR